jgi:integrase
VWALVIAIACELPSQLGLPLSRHFASSVWQVVRAENVVISLRSVQRMLARHHLKPWRYVSWMHPRDPTSSSSTPDSGRAGAWGAAITGRFEQSTHDCPAVIRIRFHDMRHTHATLLLENGGTERQVAERLGINGRDGPRDLRARHAEDACLRPCQLGCRSRDSSCAIGERC